MGYNIAAYVEHKNKDTGKWELVCRKPISCCLKYILDDYSDYPRLKWEELSTGLQELYKKEKDSEGNEVCYATFYTQTPQGLETAVDRKIKETFTKLNVIVRALGCQRIYSDEGEELEPWGDESGEKMTMPINKQLVEDLQFGYETMRNVGQREAFDLILSEFTEYGEEYRVVFVGT